MHDTQSTQSNSDKSELRAVDGSVTQSRSAVYMKEHGKVTIRRRHLLGLTIAGLAAATTGTMVADRIAVKRHDPTDKRKARFQTNSPEVRNFYRVNSYPRA
jgi:hypothetical protein